MVEGDDYDEVLAELYATFGSYRRVAEMLGQDPEIIRRDLHEAGVEMRPVGRPSQVPVWVAVMVIGMYNEGMSQAEIARLFPEQFIDQPHVGKFLRAREVETRPQGRRGK